jgi:hypothetical protein
MWFSRRVYKAGRQAKIVQIYLSNFANCFAEFVVDLVAFVAYPESTNSD